MSGRSAQRVTIADVAKSAKVSIATVSFVLNDSKPVTPEVRRRVQEAVASLSYQPSPTAKSLRTGKSATLGLIIPDLTNPFFTRLAQDIEHEARQLGYATLLADSRDDQELQNQLLTNLEQRRVEAILIVPAMNTAHTLKTYIPLVALDRTAGNTPCIQSDKYGGGCQAAEHLVALGHQQIALLAGPARENSVGERVRGMLDTLKKHRIKVAEAALEFGDYSVESGRAGAFRLLERSSFTALLAANDTLALGALSALQSEGKDVPAQVSLTGFDDIPWAALSYPALTTVQQNTAELARQAIAFALGDGKNQLKVIPTQLTVRHSTGSVNQGGSP